MGTPKIETGKKREGAGKIHFQRPPPSRHLQPFKLRMRHISYYQQMASNSDGTSSGIKLLRLCQPSNVTQRLN